MDMEARRDSYLPTFHQKQLQFLAVSCIDMKIFQRKINFVKVNIKYVLIVRSIGS
jgi:hypothetical protein